MFINLLQTLLFKDAFCNQHCTVKERSNLILTTCRTGRAFGDDRPRYDQFFIVGTVDNDPSWRVRIIAPPARNLELKLESTLQRHLFAY